MQAGLAQHLLFPSASTAFVPFAAKSARKINLFEFLWNFTILLFPLPSFSAPTQKSSGTACANNDQ
jgi:hypothetical protein